MKARKKRLKIVFKTPHEVIEKFVSRSQEYGVSKYNGRDGSKGNTSCFFEDRDLYSYGRHYLLARLGLAFNGVPIAVVNFSHYSSKTSDQSYSTSNKLEAAGYLVVKVSSKDRSIDYQTGDLELLSLVTEELENQTKLYYDHMASMSFSPYNPWYLRSIKKEIKAHNKQVLRLGLKHLFVEIDENAFKIGAKLSKLENEAREDHSTRRQKRLFDEIEYYRNSRRNRAA